MTRVPLVQEKKMVGFLCYSPTQPLTDWSERIELAKGTRIIRHKIPSNRLYRTHCCRKRRPAKNLLVNGGGWYEPTFYCKPTKGCQSGT